MKSKSIKTQKQLGQYPAMLTSRLVSKAYIHRVFVHLLENSSVIDKLCKFITFGEFFLNSEHFISELIHLLNAPHESVPRQVLSLSVSTICSFSTSH